MLWSLSLRWKPLKFSNKNRYGWSASFPDTVISATLRQATTHPAYTNAKAGDKYAAMDVALALVTKDSVEKLKTIIGSNDVVFVPVLAEEASGRNKIPLATAYLLATELCSEININIVQSSKVSRTSKDGWYRLANPPEFVGKIADNKTIVMVDDTQTQGGTFAALRGHIESQNATVLAAFALTGKQYSVQLRLSNETLKRLINAYAEIENWWKQIFGYGFESLTEWEARYLINSKLSANEVRDRIITSRNARGS